jgi:hypothetical protein
MKKNNRSGGKWLFLRGYFCKGSKLRSVDLTATP